MGHRSTRGNIGGNFRKASEVSQRKSSGGKKIRPSTIVSSHSWPGRHRKTHSLMFLYYNGVLTSGSRPGLEMPKGRVLPQDAEDFSRPLLCQAGPWVTDFRWNPVVFFFPFSFNKHVGNSSSGPRWSRKEVQLISCLQLLHLSPCLGKQRLSSVTFRKDFANKGISCPGKEKGMPWPPGISQSPQSSPGSGQGLV